MKYEVTSYNTKKMLAESLKKIMRKKVFSKITISEIIQDCGVNRKTFYYHFEDIYALLKWIFEDEAIEVVKHFDLAVEYEEAILFIMDYVEQNDYLINCAYDSIGRDELKRFFYIDFSEMVFCIMHIVENETGKVLDGEYKNFLCDFYTEALVGILVEWIKKHEADKRMQVIEYISVTIKSSLIAIVNTYGAKVE
ncbi:MAG: TetR family transcriptional regulator [Lachnospiraceae bacterium]|nr:TetR family transcriptional regulator [Lachnospiraceae bacterium]